MAFDNQCYSDYLSIYTLMQAALCLECHPTRWPTTQSTWAVDQQQPSCHPELPFDKCPPGDIHSLCSASQNTQSSLPSWVQSPNTLDGVDRLVLHQARQTHAFEWSSPPAASLQHQPVQHRTHRGPDLQRTLTLDKQMELTKILQSNFIVI